MNDNVIEFPMLELKAAWKEAATRLKKHDIAMPLLDSRLLLQEAIGISYEELLADPTRKLNQKEVELYAQLLARRMHREPVSVIIGRKPFWKHEFVTSKEVLDPRPDSETLVDVLVKRYAVTPPQSILELGVGSGCLILSLLSEWQNAEGLAIDLSDEALTITSKNAKLLGVNSRIHMQKSDWFGSVEGQFDLIISNPPYIPSEDIKTLEPEVRDYDPLPALDGGVDGLDAYHQIISQAAPYLADSGVLALEIGDDQEVSVGQIAESHGFDVILKEPDLRGTIRCLLLEKR